MVNAELQFKALLQFLGTLSGRDKLAKIVAYASRIIIWHYEKSGNKQKAISWGKLKNQLSAARRVPRLLAFLDCVPVIREHQGDKQLQARDPLSWHLTNLANWCDFFYFISDNVTFFHKSGLGRLSDGSLHFWDDLVGCWTWFVSLVICLYLDTKRCLQLRRERAVLQRKQRQLLFATDPTPPIILANGASASTSTSANEYGEVSAKVRQLSANLRTVELTALANLFDFQCALVFCFPNRKIWSSPMVGLFGVLNASVSAYNRWPRPALQE